MIGASDIPLEGALGKEGGVEQILFRGCGGLGRDIEMGVILSLLINVIIYYEV